MIFLSALLSLFLLLAHWGRMIRIHSAVLLYNAVKFLPNIHHKHPIAHPNYGVSVVSLISDTLSATVVAVSYVI